MQYAEPVLDISFAVIGYFNGMPQAYICFKNPNMDIH